MIKAQVLRQSVSLSIRYVRHGVVVAPLLSRRKLTCRPSNHACRPSTVTSRRSIVARAVDRPDADKKFDDYAPKVAFFFPGQGAQTVGMWIGSAPHMGRVERAP